MQPIALQAFFVFFVNAPFFVHSEEFLLVPAQGFLRTGGASLSRCVKVFFVNFTTNSA
jgi:hypothetical protein